MRAPGSTAAQADDGGTVRRRARPAPMTPDRAAAEGGARTGGLVRGEQRRRARRGSSLAGDEDDDEVGGRAVERDEGIGDGGAGRLDEVRARGQSVSAARHEPDRSTATAPSPHPRRAVRPLGVLRRHGRPHASRRHRADADVRDQA